MEKALEGMEAELGTELHSQLAPSEQQEVSIFFSIMCIHSLPLSA